MAHTFKSMKGLKLIIYAPNATSPMGVRGLLTYCLPIKKHANMNERGLHIGIDGFSLLFLFREEREEFEKYLKNILLCGNVSIVMDKRAAKEKREVVQERKDIRKEAKTEANTLTSFTQTPEYDELDEMSQAVLAKVIAQKERAAWCLYPEYMKWFVLMAEGLGIVVSWAEGEADSVLARGGYDVVISSDSDLLILGSKRLWLPHRNGYHSEINGAEFKTFLGLEGDQLFELAYLAGCDVQTQSLMNVKEAVSRLRFYGSLEGIFKVHPEIVKESDILAFQKLKSVWA